MNWFKTHAALLVAALALAVGASALGLSLADDDGRTRGHHSMNAERGAMMHHGGPGMHRGGMDEESYGAPGRERGPGMDEGMDREPGMGHGGMKHDMGDHDAHAAAVAKALQAKGIEVSPEDLADAMEQTHPSDMGSSPATR